MTRGSLTHRLRRHSAWGKAAFALALVGAAIAAVPAQVPAQAAAGQKVTAATAVARSCHAKYVDGAAGTQTVTATAPVTGLVRARLSGGGDWDLGVFDFSSGRTVAGSAGFTSNELAEGFVKKGQKLRVQACRFRGSASSADLSIDFVAIAEHSIGKVKIVDVNTPTRKLKQRLQGLDLDLTEHGDSNSVEVVLHGTADERKLREAGFTFSVRIADLESRSKSNATADSKFAAANPKTQLPSGSNAYRHLADYNLELKQLAIRYPGLVKELTLNHQSVEGRDIHGIEITQNPNARDGKPIFLQMGVHHAREWPSSEHVIEFAYDLLTNYGRSSRTTDLVNTTRTIVVPIVNVDGFNLSREARHAGFSASFGLFDYEMKRKNCRISSSTPAQYASGTCGDNAAGRLRGTDPNRNYGGLWGGSGASVSWSNDTFRGDAPFSEPEIQNIRELQSTRSITNLITNHTFSNLVLRPPGVADMGAPLEESLVKALGARMTSHNGYANIPGYGLYDTTGSTEDWTFWTAGSLGFTYEIGPDEFHPPYNNGVVDEYLGRGQAAGAGRGGNREAYYEMLTSTKEEALHSVIEGSAPAGSTLTISKTFLTETSPIWNNDYGTDIGAVQTFQDTLEYSMVTDGTTFEWNVNPSTRPVVAGRDGRDALGPPQGPIALANPAGQPGENTGDPLAGAHEEIEFEVEGLPTYDNGRMAVHIDWGDANTDWDLYVYDAAGNLVAQSAAFGDTTEDAVLFDPPPGTYTAVVVNFDQVDGQAFDDWGNGGVTFQSPRPRVENPVKEAWTLTCKRPNGTLASPIEVIVDRGGRADIGDACA
ncbi:M14 family metallopeptidase [Nocardioides sp. CPCC 206347]|uniref:M14 family metallopeptidase n=1 Tax=Nocardioides sp. CPCC 206347 TaxID=3406463 RepID=UPI003B437C05